MRPRTFLFGLFSLILGLVPLGFGLVAGTSAVLASPSCSAPTASGLTAKVVAKTGQTISGVIDATGCDVGVYVGAGVTGVVIQHATITNANDHGILVQDTWNVGIFDNSVIGNDINVHQAIQEDKAISLAGTSHVTVNHNLVSGNTGSGGIGIYDDGTVNPAGLIGGKSLPGNDNTVTNNTVLHNMADCGIVVAAYNAGKDGGVSGNLIEGNTVSQNVAGIVIAADAPGTMVSNNIVDWNTVTDNMIPGIIVHSNAPGDVVSGTIIHRNTVSGNGADKDVGLTAPAGIVLAGSTFGPTTPPATVTNTSVTYNWVKNEHFGVAVINADHSTVLGAALNHAWVPVFTTP